MKNYDELLSEFPDPEHTDFTKMGSGYLIINVLSRVAQNKPYKGVTRRNK